MTIEGPNLRDVPLMLQASIYFPRYRCTVPQHSMLVCFGRLLASM
jgi:hypothetical protein